MILLAFFILIIIIVFAEITAMFMYAKDAQAVIDNPNFRVILDTLCK